MLELRDFMPVNFLKKEKFTGSHNGMRFRMEKLDLEGEDGPRLGVTIWPEPYGYDATPEEEKDILFDFLSKHTDRLYKYSEAQDVRDAVDPRAQNEDLGDGVKNKSD